MKMKSKTLTCASGPAYFRSMLLMTATISLALVPLAADGIPDGFPVADPRTIDIEVRLRDTQLLEGERIQFEILLRNAGSEPLPIAIPFEERGLGWIAGSQLFLEPIWSDDSHVKRDAALSQEYYARALPARVDQAPWPPCDIYQNKTTAMIEWLRPGHEIAIIESRIDTSPFFLNRSNNLSAIKASWLTGPSDWAESNIVPLTFQKWDRKTHAETVFEGVWMDRGKVERKAKVMLVNSPVGNFLFSSIGGFVRLAQVAPEEYYEIHVQSDIPQLIITFPNSTRGSKYFHLDEGIVGSTSWGPDGFTQFTPKPEPIPIVELAALRARMGLNPDGSVPENRENDIINIDSNQKIVNNGIKASQPSTTRTLRLLVLISVVVLAVLALFTRLFGKM